MNITYEKISAVYIGNFKDTSSNEKGSNAHNITVLLVSDLVQSKPFKAKSLPLTIHMWRSSIQLLTIRMPNTLRHKF